MRKLLKLFSILTLSLLTYLNLSVNPVIAQKKATICKWKQLWCGTTFDGVYEACITSGDGNNCSDYCGNVTRNCD